ncbi:MAG: serine/threonine-protein kinase [Mycobacteriales bacterium]
MSEGPEGTARTVGGRYTLVERLGAGGMGTVWRATDTVLGRDVAIKEVTFPRGVSDEERAVLRERTRREARAAAQLDHPSAVTVYDVAEEDGVPYLVMELVEARTLSEVVRSDGPLSPHATAQMGLAVLGALEAAHQQGIVHRDGKPSNVLLRSDGRVVLTDFGIATFSGDSSITSTGLLLGSPSYIAPERARGQAPGPASDLWSLGATMFTAVEGAAPYDKGEPLPTMTAVVTGDRAPYVAAGPLIPALEGLLEADPAVRMDASAARAALVAVTAGDAPVRHGHLSTAPSEADRTSALNVGDVQADVAHDAALAEAPAHVAGTGTFAPARVLEPRSHQRRPRTERPRALLPALALAVVAALGVLAVSLGGPGSAILGPGSSPSPSQSGSQAAALPADWQPIDGSAGWKTGVPASYVMSTFNNAAQWKDQNTGRTLRISTGRPQADVLKDREFQAGSFAKSHTAYQQIRIEKADFRDYEAADWEFSYTDGGAELHALNRVFVANDAGYSIFFQTRSTDDWGAARKDFDQIVASFQP